MKYSEITRLLLPAAGLLGITSLAQAQTDLYTIFGAQAEDKAGASVSTAGLYNLDGSPDLIMGSTEDPTIFTAGPGRATVHSGPTGGVLATFVGDSSFDQFGTSVAGGFDFNNDGRNDVAVGAPLDSNFVGGGGMLRVYSGATNGLIFQLDGSTINGKLGTSVADCGDVNNDGFSDVIVGIPGDDTVATDAGSAVVISGNGGVALWTVFGTLSGQQYGTSVTGMGDLNGDSMDDFAVGSIFGGVRIFDGATGTVLRTFPSTGTTDFYGAAIANAGDVDGDAINDIIIGATEADVFSPGTGFVDIFSGASGLLIRRVMGDSPGDHFGTSVASAGDMDGDGHDEVIVGADQIGQGAPMGFSTNGYARVLDGMTGGTVFDVTSTDPSNGINLGTSVAGLGDLDGDGSLEVGVGAPKAPSANGVNLLTGHVRIVSGQTMAGGCGTSTYCVAGTNSSGTEAMMGSFGSTSVTANDLALTATGATPNTLGIFFYGRTKLNAIPIAGTSSFRCVGSGGVALYRLGQSMTSGTGGAVRFLNNTSGPMGGNTHGGSGLVTPGSTWHFSFFYRDAVEPLGFNIANGLEAVFCP